ncbi:tetratricopeptide repeat protein [Panacagrimonas sp.]|uniref:tetratricopeptide repeat protein n=1 Tax=Panacagrimonas sp. TaxID=2480088 RepID=UPI003B51C4D3
MSARAWKSAAARRICACLAPLWLIGLSGSADAARNTPSTVGQIAESNGLTEDGWFRVRTPSILRVEVGDLVPGDARAAIEQYDLLLQLPPAAIEPNMRAEALRRASDLRVQLADQDSADGQGFHVSEVRRAIADYQRLLHDHPGYPHNDRALYQLARAHQLVQETEPAIMALTTLGTRHPHSQRAADAWFRAGEMLFVRKRFDESERAYAGVLALGPQAAYYELAQYKYGWSLYKRSQFERAAQVFLAILDRDLPAGILEDGAAALAAVDRDKSDRAQESLRMVALSFAALGGGPALNRHLADGTPGSGVSRMESLLYAELGQVLLQQERYTEAAGTYLAFTERHPAHPRAPEFHAHAIGAFRSGGFGALALEAQGRYAEWYAPDAGYWAQREPDTVVLAEVRRYHDELGRHHQAIAQQARDPAARQAGYLQAAQWYRRTLQRFPQDPQTPQTSLLLADALLEGGRTEDAARQYEATAYELPAHAQAPVAAFAAVQTWHRQLQAARGPARDQAQVAAINAALKLAETFPDHPQRAQVLMAAAEGQFARGHVEDAIATSEQVLAAPAAPEPQRAALNLIGDAHFSQARYAQAETAYARLAGTAGAGAGARQLAVEQLAASVYKQGEAARNDGDQLAAAGHFERVAQVAPGASIRAAADYDAAAALLVLEDWPRAAVALERFREFHPQHRLLADADKKLALAYEKGEQPARAAAVYQRVAQRADEPPEVRRVAAWTAATLYEQAGMAAQSFNAYLAYVNGYPQPLDPAMQARLKLSQLAMTAQRDPSAHQYWLQQIVTADSTEGGVRSDAVQRIAAQASLELGRLQAAAAARLALRMPLERSLAARKAATETSVRSLERAAAYGYAEITSAATFELATVYADFGRALMQSERPAQLAGDALEQYHVLLEEQAYPFEEKAIQAHEVNLSRVRKGIWNDAIGRSVAALGQLSPAKYGKQERREASYDELH